MGGLGEGCKKPYRQQVSCIIKLALIVNGKEILVFSP